MKKTNSKLSKINSEDFIFSQMGEASTKQFLYLLDKKKEIDDLFQNKKPKKVKRKSPDFLNPKEKDLYDYEFDKNQYEDNIFDKDYEIKYKQEKEEKMKKYKPPKNSCTYINTFKNLIQMMNKNKNQEVEKQKDEALKSKQRQEIEKQLIYDLSNERYRYHLMHHHHDLYVDKSLINSNQQSSGASYLPKVDLIFKKLVYSPEFGKMVGRYDQETKKGIKENNKEILLKKQKEKEFKNFQKQLRKIRKSIRLQQNQREDSESELEEERISNRRRSMYENITNNFGNNNLLKRNSTIETENGSRNFNKIIIKKNSSASVKIGKGKYNENNYNLSDEKKNMSNNFEENTASSMNHNITNSVKNKIKSEETEELQPNNTSKNESNILINDNNNSPKKSLNGKQPSNTLNNIIRLRKTSDCFSSMNKKYRNNSSLLSTSKNSIILPHKIVNFEKMISRDYLERLKKHKANTYVVISPNYDKIKPKVIMKVRYRKQKHDNKYKKKEFNNFFGQMLFDVDKSYNNYNNHFAPKSIYIGKMIGRKSDTILPTYMLDQYNRNSFNTFNDKSLKMNNFSNGSLRPQRSSFNQKRTFNYKLNDQYSGNDNDGFDKDLDSIFRKITMLDINSQKSTYNENNSLSCPSLNKNNSRYIHFRNHNLRKIKIPEYYKINLDKYGKYRFSIGEKIDGFTMKTIKTNKSALNLLSEREKKIFSSNLDE